MNIKFKFIVGKVIRIKLYQEELDRLLRAIAFYEEHHPKNTWTQEMSSWLLKQEWISIDDPKIKNWNNY